MAATIPTPARGFKLTIGFGLVNVGVKYAPLVQEQRAKGHYVCPDHLSPVTQQYVCEKDGQVVKPISAYEHDGREVVLEDRDALKSKRDGRLELQAFVEMDSIDPLYLEKTYLLWPDKGQEMGYDLLRDVLAGSGKVLIGTAVLSKSTKAVVIRYGQGCLLAHVCTYDANVAWGDHRLVTMAASERPAKDKAMVEQALTYFGSLADEFDFSAVTDEYDARLREAIEATAKGKPVKVKVEADLPPVADLMAALKATVEQAKEKDKPKRPRKKAAA